MWSSVANLKENLNKIAHDVHDDDEDDDEDLTIYGSTNGGTDRRNSNGFRYSRSPMANGFESPVNPEVYFSSSSSSSSSYWIHWIIIYAQIL